MSEIVKKMVDAFGRTAEDKRAKREITDVANAEARLYWKDPTWRAEFAAELTESILLGFEYETLVDRWIESETTDMYGRIFTREATGIKAFWMARGGYIESSQMSAEISEVPRDMLGVHVEGFEDKFANNFTESAQTLRDLAIQRMDSEINRRIHTVMSEAIPTGSPYAITAPGVSKGAVDNAIRAVADASRTSDVVIVGRPTMVDQIVDFEGYGVETLEEIRQKGILGTYRGATIVRLRNFKDEDGTPYLPGNQMWIMARDTGKFAFFGGLQSKEYETPDNWFWNYIARRDCGLLVGHPERARLLTDSNQAS
jgi:hypothetical protein